MTAKAKKSAPVAETATYTNLLATCVRSSKMTNSGKTITHYELKNESIIESWSFADEPHNIAVGQRVLLRAKHMPDGKVFYNLQ